MDDSARRSVAPTSAEHDFQVVRAAWWYYKDGLTQAQIADLLFVSRATVGRLLEEARTSGVVRFEISADHLAAFELSRRIQVHFGLEDAVVVPTVPDEATGPRVNQRIANAGAEYLRRFLRPGAVIGVGWGDTVLRVLFALSRYALDGVTFASVAGGIDAYTREISARQNNGIQDHLRLIPAPLVASTPEIARALRRDASVLAPLELSRSAVATLTGIGAASEGAAAVRAGLFSADQVRGFRAMGGVGDMLGEWFKDDGEVLAEATSDRRIGLDLDELRAMPHVIGLAGGAEKTAAIRGALRGGYLDVLVTDEAVAVALLDGDLSSRRREGS